jgi:hypothetical protein
MQETEAFIKGRTAAVMWLSTSAEVLQRDEGCPKPPDSQEAKEWLAGYDAVLEEYKNENPMNTEPWICTDCLIKHPDESCREFKCNEVELCGLCLENRIVHSLKVLPPDQLRKKWAVHNHDMSASGPSSYCEECGYYENDNWPRMPEPPRNPDFVYSGKRDGIYPLKDNRPLLELVVSKPDDYYRCRECNAEYSEEEGMRLKRCIKH